MIPGTSDLDILQQYGHIPASSPDSEEEEPTSMRGSLAEAPLSF